MAAVPLILHMTTKGGNLRGLREPRCEDQGGGGQLSETSLGLDGTEKGQTHASFTQACTGQLAVTPTAYTRRVQGTRKLHGVVRSPLWREVPGGRGGLWSQRRTGPRRVDCR